MCAFGTFASDSGPCCSDLVNAGAVWSIAARCVALLSGMVNYGAVCSIPVRFFLWRFGPIWSILELFVRFQCVFCGVAVRFGGLLPIDCSVGSVFGACWL